MLTRSFDNLTLATFLKAEFGFFGVVVYTLVQTPRFNAQACNAGTLFLITCFTRFFFNNWLIVGIIIIFLRKQFGKQLVVV